MRCYNTTCKHNQLGLECTKVPYNIEYMCSDMFTDFSKKKEGDDDKESSNNKNVKM